MGNHTRNRQDALERRREDLTRFERAAPLTGEGVKIVGRPARAEDRSYVAHFWQPRQARVS